MIVSNATKGQTLNLDQVLRNSRSSFLLDHEQDAGFSAADRRDGLHSYTTHHCGRLYWSTRPHSLLDSCFGQTLRESEILIALLCTDSA